MGNLCGKGENTVAMTPSNEDSNKSTDHQHADEHHKKEKVVKPPSNNTADLLGLAKEKEVIVIE